MTYLDEMRDTVGLAALHLGYDPASITQEQFDACIALVEQARTEEWVRQILGNQYTELMIGGGAVLAIGWSGDIALIQNRRPKDFEWVLATEGGMLWTDNMAIPKGTPNKLLAEHWINFYYDPNNAAIIEAYVNYVCPVKGAREVMLTLDPELANNPLIFPPDGLGGSPPPVPRHDRPGGVPLGQGVHQGRGPLARDAQGDQLPDHRPVRAAGARPALAGGLLRLPGDPDVPGLAVDRATSRTGSSRPGTGGSTRRRSTSTGRGSPGRSSTAAWRPSSPSPSGSRWRTPSPSGAAPTRTCCCSWSSPRSSPASCCGRCPGRSSCPTTGSSSGRSRRSGSSRPTSSCWRRRRRSSPASPTTSCRS